MKVSLKELRRDTGDTIDAVRYLKRRGEHLLAVKVVKWRKGEIALGEFSADLMDVVADNGHHLVNE